MATARKSAVGDNDDDVIHVKFISDEDVIGHIVHINDKRKKFNGTSRSRRQSDAASLCHAMDTNHFDDEQFQENHPKPRILLHDITKGLLGSDVFSFQKNRTPRTQALKLHEKAVVSAERAKQLAREPKTTLLSAKKSQRLKNKKIEVKTPNNTERTRNLRRRINIKQCLAESSDSEFIASSSSSSSDSEEEVIPNKISTSQPLVEIDARTCRTPVVERRSRKRPVNENLISSAEAYFEAHNSAAPTSDHTLARLENPKLDHSSVISLLKTLSLNHGKEIQRLNQSYKAKFKKWMFQLSENFNLLLYGVGSKRQLMLQFQETIEDAEGLVVNGFFPNMNLKSVLSYIIEEVLHESCQGQDQIEFINKSMDEDYRDIYIFFNNIDGTVLRSEKTQNLLSQLAMIKGIHVVASIDHINAPLIWDQTRLSRFNWLWYNVTTFEPYTNETAFENSLLMQPSSELVLSSLIHVFRSLNPKAKGIFLLLAKHQLENTDNTNYTGMSYQECYRKCREAFLVNSDLTMKAQLTEFKDHKLVKSKKGADGIDYLTIPLEAATLSEFVTEHAKDI